MEEIEKFIEFLKKRSKVTMNEAGQELARVLGVSVALSVAKDNKIFKEGLGKAAAKKAAWIGEMVKEGHVHVKHNLRKMCKGMCDVSVRELEKHLDLAYLQTKNGSFTQEQAISQAVKNLSKKGIHSIDYDSGRSISIEAAVRRDVLTAVNRTAGEITLEKTEGLGVDLVKTSEHLGARPTHAEWQGQVFSLTGKGGYPDFYEETGYGEVDGLCGINCRHSFYPFFEEVEDKNQKADIGDSRENERRYKAEQEQRYNERKIREWKRRADVMEAGGQDNTRETQKVKEWQSRQRGLVSENDLDRKYEREQID